MRRNHTGHRVGQEHHRARMLDVAVARMRYLRERDPSLWTLEVLADLFNVPLATARDWCDYATRPL